MQEQELKAFITEALDSALDRRAKVDSETHRAHHAYIENCIERDKNRAARLEHIRRHVIGWSVVSGLGLVGWSIGDWVIHALQQALKAKGGP